MGTDEPRWVAANSGPDFYAGKMRNGQIAAYDANAAFLAATSAVTFPVTLEEWAREVDRRFSTYHRAMWCPDPSHEEHYSISGKPGTDLVEWTREHWNCTEAPE